MIKYYWNHYFSFRNTNRRFESLFRGFLIGCIIIYIISIASFVFGATIPRYEKVGDFVCNIIIDNKPVKEIDGVAVVPFKSEYKLLLKNNNNRKCAAKITIDGAPISSFGDLVIGANSEVTLERFIIGSLNEGQRFKFVPLDHPEVDDPSRKENGLIRVKFRLAKEKHYIQFDDDRAIIWPDGFWNFDLTDNVLIDSDISFSDSSVNCSSSAEPGATIGGSKSDQKFHKVDIEFEDKAWVVEIRLKGVKNEMGNYRNNIIDNFRNRDVFWMGGFISSRG